VVELAWRRLGEEAVLVAFTADGQRFGVPLPGVATQFSETAVLDAARRLAGGKVKAVHETQTDYDAYYFANHRRGVAERPLPVSRVDLEDPGATRLYVDPIEGRILIKQDQSRRVYRWVFNFLHYWDFGWFNLRPLWDGWMLTWIGFGLVLSASSLVLAWRRLKLTVKVKKPARNPARVPPRPIIEPVIDCLPEIE
jgi:hypothetical protein